MTLRSLSLLAALVAVLPAAAQAQTLRIGYIDTDRVIVQLPEFQQVQQTLQQQQVAVFQQVRANQDSLDTVLRAKLEELRGLQNSPLLTDEARNERQRELLQLQAEIEGQEQQGYQYLSRVEAQLLQPLLNRIDEAIEAEAIAQGIDLVFSPLANNAPVLLYANDKAVNMTIPVLTRLGVTVTQNDGN
ncbi:MAG: OmpH family outer membrane protein [Rubricoccaceae bacterium]